MKQLSFSFVTVTGTDHTGMLPQTIGPLAVARCICSKTLQRGNHVGKASTHRATFSLANSVFILEHQPQSAPSGF